MNDITIDINKLESLPRVILDGQNIAFRHGEKIARELNRPKFFSYEGLRISFEALYRRGFKAEIVMPSFQLKEKRTKQYDKTGVVNYLKKFNVFVEVKGYESNKRDDLFILQHAFNNNSSIISNDQYRNKLEELSQNEYQIWKPWLDKNRFGFEFVDDSFITNSEGFSLEYVNIDEPLAKNSDVLIKQDKPTIPKIRHLRKPMPRPVLTYGDFKNILSDLFRG
jgi:hypothetical protein